MSSGKPHVKVIVRTRPTSNFAQGNITLDPDRKSIHLYKAKKESQGVVNNQQENWSYAFDYISQNGTQEEIYEQAAQEVVESALDGYNGTIMAYGQTGAGKTFTMTGAMENYRHRGIIPRAIEHVFREVRARSQLAITVSISYLEIYNEQLVDLLLSDTNDAPPLKVVEDGKGQTHVMGLTQQAVTSEEEAMKLLFEGDMNRSIASHALNKVSSRSHCIFTLHVETRSRFESKEKVLYGKLNLVDLAGSERVKKSQVDGVQLIEATQINKSLSFLEQVVIGLGDKKRDHVPYRSAMITNVLKDSLGGNTRTVLIANIWVELAHLEETLSTLRFASRMMKVTLDPQINARTDPEALVKKYEQDIRELKSELAMHNALVGKGQTQYEAYTPEQRQELNVTVRKYLRGEIDEIEVDSLRAARETFMQFKLIANGIEQETEARIKSQFILQPKPAGQQSIDSSPKGEDGGVGDLGKGGFAVGSAPANSKPPTSPRQPSQRARPAGARPGKESEKEKAEREQKEKEAREKEQKEKELAAQKERELQAQLEKQRQDPKAAAPNSKDSKAAAKDSTTKLPPVARSRDSKRDPLPEAPPELQQALTPTTLAAAASAAEMRDDEAKPPAPERPAAFEQFKKEKGAEFYKTLSDNKEQLVERQRSAKEYAASVNDTKRSIDQLQAQIERKKAERAAKPEFQSDDAEIMDEEEFQLIKKLRAQKQVYKDAYDKLKEDKRQIEYLTLLIDKNREKLVSEFEAWYADAFYHDPAANVGPSTHESGSDDVLDYQEQFEKMQAAKLTEQEPDGAHFFTAITSVRKNHGSGKPSSPGLPLRTKLKKPFFR